MTLIHQDCVLRLRDGFFCKDGRGWHTSASGRGHSLDWPWPSTLLGALRTAWGKSQEDEAEPFSPNQWVEYTQKLAIDRMIALRRSGRAEIPWSSANRMWPAPSDALALDARADFLNLGTTLACPQATLLGRERSGSPSERLLIPRIGSKSKPAPMPKWWSESDFAAWLAGDTVKVPPKDSFLAPTARVQAHVGIHHDTGTADEGILFAHDVVETIDADGEWAIGLGVNLPTGKLPTSARIGADGRIADVHPAEPSLWEFPTHVRDAFALGSPGLRLVVVTPALFSGGWLPDWLAPDSETYRGVIPSIEAEVELRAAFVERPVHVSGWDMAAAAEYGRGGAPKKTDRMVPPGSVYFFTKTNGTNFTAAEAERLWLAQIGSRGSEGFSTAVPGVWIVPEP